MLILKNAPKISIIIPVYQAETYLAPCIDSILCQSWKNFELLLIDDGSKDQSGKICDEYALKDHRITVFHCKNQGVSKSRNFGLRQASGDYVLFVDADDLIKDTYIEKLYETIPHDCENAIAMCGYQLLQDGSLSEKQEPLSCFQKGQGSIFDQYLKPLITRQIQGTCWRVLYPAAFLKQQEILFPGCKIAEDLLFFINVIIHCQKICVCKEPLYLYRQIQESSSHRSYITNYLPDRLLYIQNLQEILKVAPLQEEQRQWLLSFSFQFCRMLLYMNATASPNSHRELQEIDESIFGTRKTPKDMQRNFTALLSKKHKVLNFLVTVRMFTLIRLIREHKRHPAKMTS